MRLTASFRHIEYFAYGNLLQETPPSCGVFAFSARPHPSPQAGSAGAADLIIMGPNKAPFGFAMCAWVLGLEWSRPASW